MSAFGAPPKRRSQAQHRSVNAPSLRGADFQSACLEKRSRAENTEDLSGNANF